MHERHLDVLLRETMYQRRAKSRDLSHGARGVVLVVQPRNGSTMRSAVFLYIPATGAFFVHAM